MKILVINSWSSSIKYDIFDMIKKKSLSSWLVEEIWSKNSLLLYKYNNKQIKIKQDFKNHEQALTKIIEILTQLEDPILSNIKEISAIWHRIVHWWEYFSKPTIINNSVIKNIEKCSPLAPLHNPANLIWIKVCQKLIPDIPQIAVFDTAFYQSMPVENYLYPIPIKYYKKDKIRKYWFHWTSHDYVSHKACKFLELNYNKQKVISCHVWNWASITAIKNWKVINTSMWMTPLDWLMMGSRSWSIDPSIIWVLYEKENTKIKDINNILNTKSWLLWISQKSSDMREIIKWIELWDSNCKLAYDMFINRIIQYIWSYITLLWWVDIIVLTAGILENRPSIRKDIINKLKFLWAELDNKKNSITWKDIKISLKSSKINIVVIKTKEEYMIAKHTYKLLKIKK